MEFVIYLLISEDSQKTYVGYSSDINRRIKEHRRGIVTTTKSFGKFRCFKLEKNDGIIKARKREKYWKSHAGRKKLKNILAKIILAPSSNG